jgi:hypothetical protein
MAHQIPKKGGGGPTLDQAEEKDLLYWLDRKTNDLADGKTNPQYEDRERDWIEAAKAELARRGVVIGCGAGARTSTPQPRPPNRPAQPAQPRPSTAMTRMAEHPQTIVAGTFSNAAAASAALLEASRKYHLITPATVVGSLPEGCEVIVSIVQVDPYGPEVYAITGNKREPKDDDTVGLDKNALAKIAKAAGVSWISSRRTDDASHPHYCAWEAVCRAPNFDMTESVYPGNVDIDTREDGDVSGPAAQEIRNKGKERTDGGDSQLLELRKFLMRHCESKAMNKAIGNMGVRRSYKRADLNKPFAVARLAFTGASNDPEARREFRQMIGQRFLGATQQLYGGAPGQTAVRSLPTAAPTYQLHAPPPLGMTIDQSYGADPDPMGDMEQPYAAPPARPTPKPEPTPHPPAADAGPTEYLDEERV